MSIARHVDTFRVDAKVSDKLANFSQSEGGVQGLTQQLGRGNHAGLVRRSLVGRHRFVGRATVKRHDSFDLSLALRSDQIENE